MRKKLPKNGWVGWFVGGEGGVAYWVKIYFFSFFSLLMFLAQNQLGRVGEGLGGSQGLVRGGLGLVGGVHIGSK